MTCPFLREAEVAYCQSASVRTLIPLAQSAEAQKKCASPEHVSCALYRSQGEGGPPAETCPHLRRSLMQYCAAAPVTKFIPYSESLLSRCGNDSYRYCEVYLNLSNPGATTTPADEIAVPDGLLYSENHMWLDLAGDTCHVGIDSFLSRVLGTIEAVTYVQKQKRPRAAVVLRSHGIDLEMIFPNAFQVTACNLRLRANPARITTEPYTAGWLFEGVPGMLTASRLRKGPQAKEWMQEETRRMNESVQEYAKAAADGGLFVRDLGEHLPADAMRALFHEFFSPFASEEEEP